MSQIFQKDDFVKLVGTNGNFRYGFVLDTQEANMHLAICMHDEGESKIGYDDDAAKLRGETPMDWQVVLTETEKLLLPLLANGLDTKQIAEAMHISPVTVRAHIRTLRLKTHLDTRAQLTAYAQGLNKLLSET